MRVVVAGASGMIGTALVSRLRREGWEVVRLVRRTPVAPDERRWDPPAGVIEPLTDVDAVVNLCGAGVGDRRWSQARKQVLLDSRVEPTEVLAAEVAARKVPVLVNASAVGYYGDTGGRIADEGSPAGKDFLAELCVRWEAAAATDARVVTLRTAPVLGTRGGLLGPLRPLFNLALGGRLGSGRQHMPWIHLNDQVEAILFLLNSTIAGPVNLVAPLQVTNAEFTKAFAKARHRPAPWVVPSFALKAVLGEMAGSILMTQRVVPKVLLDNGFRFTFTSLEDALADTESR